MNDEEYKHNVSALISEELYGLIELYLSQLEVRSDTMSPKKKSVNHKFSMTK